MRDLQKHNKFLLIKCIVLGGLCFPAPFFMIFYLYSWSPPDFRDRFLLVLFLILCGGMLGVVAYYKDAAISAMKDWLPSSRP